MGTFTLKGARNNVDLTQWEAANLIGVDRKTIGWWETGQSSPTVEQLKEASVVYGITMYDFDLYNLSGKKRS